MNKTGETKFLSLSALAEGNLPAAHLFYNKGNPTELSLLTSIMAVWHEQRERGSLRWAKFRSFRGL